MLIYIKCKIINADHYGGGCWKKLLFYFKKIIQFNHQQATKLLKLMKLYLKLAYNNLDLIDS